MSLPEKETTIVSSSKAVESCAAPEPELKSPAFFVWVKRCFSWTQRPENDEGYDAEINPPDDLEAQLDDHKKWVETETRQGKRLDIQAKKPEYIRIRDEHGLKGRNLKGARIYRVRFWEVDLTDTNLTDVEGLLPTDLSGAVLTRTCLPEKIGDFSETLKQVEELSKNTGKQFLSLTIALAFVLLSVFKMKDIDLILDSGSVKLPIIDAEVPARPLFLLAPIVLYVLYLSTHLYLLRLWRQLATLPAVFPDGTTQDKKTYPWLLNDQIGAYSKPLRGRREPLAFTQWVVSAFLIYWLLPLGCVLIWMRYLCRHDWFVTLCHAGLIGLSVWTALLYTYMGTITLKCDRKALQAALHWWGRGNRKAMWWRGLISVVLAGGIGWLSLQALCPVTNTLPKPFAYLVKRPYVSDLDVPDGPAWSDAQQVVFAHRRYAPFGNGGLETLTPYLEDLMRTFPLLEQIGFSTSARVANSDFSSHPAEGKTLPAAPKWGKGDQYKNRLAKYRAEVISLVKTSARLSERDLQFARCDNAYMPGTDLTNAHLEWARLTAVNLTGAKLSGARLRGANMQNADLTGAYFGNDESISALTSDTVYSADLCGANLSGATLNGVSLRGVKLELANLSDAKLIGADLSDARLWNADLKGTDFSGATLEDAELDFAEYDSHTIWPSKKYEEQLKNLYKVKFPRRKRRGILQNPEATRLTACLHFIGRVPMGHATSSFAAKEPPISRKRESIHPTPQAAGHSGLIW